ncbi:MAG: recombinase family protein [Muribaculaceae bacterium]|nr:recombinase family protein [Muribaculaceae bacterium]
MKIAVIYARYSSDAQSEQSIEGQLRVCQQYAQENEYLIVDTYIDRAMTGTNDMRPDFQRMLRDSSKKQFEAVIVYKLDRFSRNKYESTIHKKTLKDNGVKLISAMENIPDTPEGIILESLLEGMNAYYSAELAQKVNRGIRESWLKGNSTGGVCTYGYTVVNKKYFIDEQEAEIIKEVFTKYSQGFKARAIANDFQERGVRRKDGKYLTAKNLYIILHNIRYTGRVYHDGREYDNIYPRIISDELWQKVSLINDDNKIAPSCKKEIYDYILSGKLICGNCKERMCGISGTGRNGAHHYYSCLSKRKRKHECNLKSVRKQVLEDIVINTTATLLKDKNNIRFIAERIFNLHKQQTDNDFIINGLITQRNEAEKASRNLLKAIEMGIITEQTKQRLTELERQINQLDFDIDREKQRNYTYLSVKDIERFLQSKVFDNTENINIRKLLVNTFIKEILLYDNEIIITYYFSDNPEKIKFSKEHFEEIEKQSKQASAWTVSISDGSYIFSDRAPKEYNPNCLLITSEWFGFTFYIENI